MYTKGPVLQAISSGISGVIGRVLDALKTEPNQLAGERNIGTSNQYFASVEEWNYTLWSHGDGDTIISSNPVLLKEMKVISALTGDITLRDGTLATDTDFTGAISTADQWGGIKLNNGLFVDDNATAGQIMLIWRDQ